MFKSVGAGVKVPSFRTDICEKRCKPVDAPPAFVIYYPAETSVKGPQSRGLRMAEEESNQPDREDETPPVLPSRVPLPPPPDVSLSTSDAGERRPGADSHGTTGQCGARRASDANG